jgi:hypothetical protein
MALFHQTIDASSRVKRPVPDKEILWPTATGHGDNYKSDSTKFPKLEAIKVRKAAFPAEPLAAFVAEVKRAQDRILVLDENLFKKEGEITSQVRVGQVLDWFPDSFAASDVRLLTASFGDTNLEGVIIEQFAERARQINSMSAYSSGFTIKVRFTLKTKFPYVHDRFAIIDDELWHFGATVGGLHSQVNAATRGWSADEHHAKDFFDLAWNGDPDSTGFHDKRSSKKWK